MLEEVTTLSSLDLSLPRFAFGESGIPGMRQVNGRIMEEDRKELRFPNSCRVFRKMAKDPTIASGLSVFEMFISRVNWRVSTGNDKSRKMKAKARFLEECLFKDMEIPLKEVIREISSMYTYGFSVTEKSFRYRTPESGSKFSDNKIGIRKLSHRAQETLSQWVFSDDGRELKGVIQDINSVYDKTRFSKLTQKYPAGKIPIRRDKFLLFRVNPRNGNPEGSSPLRSCYDAWLSRVSIERQEQIGISRDMNGMATMHIPPKYMAEDAPEPDKRTYEQFKNMLRNIHNNEQSSMILPLMYDPDSRQPLFKFELVSTQGGKLYDLDKVIRRWDNKILMVLFADALKMGQDQVGSYALAGQKTNLMALAIDTRLREIAEVFNNDLIPQLFKLNGYPTDEELPTLEFGELDKIDMDEFSKAIQRIMSVGGIEVDRPVLNRIRESIGVEIRDIDEPVNWDEIPNSTSRAGDGMKTPGEGTSTTVSGKDNSIANKENV